MPRKSAYMLRTGMTVIIDNARQVITDLQRDDLTRRIVITCGDHEYVRTYGVKIDVVGSDR